NLCTAVEASDPIIHPRRNGMDTLHRFWNWPHLCSVAAVAVATLFVAQAVPATPLFHEVAADAALRAAYPAESRFLGIEIDYL
ncbi:hypothetical protein K8I85_03540, partial [bacterium]|nr:hypothetical protein [bacterium]